MPSGLTPCPRRFFWLLFKIEIMKIVKMRPGTSETLAPAKDHCNEMQVPEQVRDDGDDSDLFQGEDFCDEEIDWEYQGKSKRQVEGSYKIFSLCLLLFFIALLMWIMK